MTETEPNALARLIAERRRATGETYEEIGGRADMPKATVYKLATKPLVDMPKAETLAKLARGLALPLDVVTRAAQQATGYHVYTETLPDTDTQVLIAHFDALTPEQRRNVLALVTSMLDEKP